MTLKRKIRNRTIIKKEQEKMKQEIQRVKKFGKAQRYKLPCSSVYSWAKAMKTWQKDHKCCFVELCIKNPFDGRLWLYANVTS